MPTHTESMSQNGLRRLALYDVLLLASSLSGKSLDEIAAEMGWSPSNANRIYSRDNYWPTLPNIPRLCAVLGNRKLLEWLEVQAVECGLVHEANSVDPAGLVMSLGRIMAEMGDVSRVAMEALEDGQISRAEARKLLRELRDVMTECEKLTERLRALDPTEG